MQRNKPIIACPATRRFTRRPGRRYESCKPVTIFGDGSIRVEMKRFELLATLVD